jgi:hypothetical protein
MFDFKSRLQLGGRSTEPSCAAGRAARAAQRAAHADGVRARHKAQRDAAAAASLKHLDRRDARLATEQVLPSAPRAIIAPSSSPRLSSPRHPISSSSSPHPLIAPPRGARAGGQAPGGGRRAGAEGARRARSHCRLVAPLIHFVPVLLTYSVPLFLKRQCDRTIGARGGGSGRPRGGPGPPESFERPSCFPP